MTRVECYSDFAVGLEPADARTVSCARIHDHERPAALVNFGTLGRDDPNEHIVDRPRTFSAIDDGLDAILQDVRRVLVKPLTIGVSPPPHDVEVQDRSLPGVDRVRDGFAKYP